MDTPSVDKNGYITLNIGDYMILKEWALVGVKHEGNLVARKHIDVLHELVNKGLLENEMSKV